MAFAVPEGLAPELYPLAWLLGTWRGSGLLAYPGIAERAFVQEVTFGHDGGPYLGYTSTTWLVEEAGADAPGARVGEVWEAESGYWRVPPGAGQGTSTEIEVLLAVPSGHVSVYLGEVRGPRVEMATDLVARTASAAEISAASRMYGLVDGDLMWAADLAAFGHPLQPYASARLTRLSGE